MLHYVLLDINYYLEEDTNVRVVQDLQFILPNCGSYNVCMIIGTTKNITDYLTKYKLTEHIKDIKEV